MRRSLYFLLCLTIIVGCSPVQNPEDGDGENSGEDSGEDNGEGGGDSIPVVATGEVCFAGATGDRSECLSLIRRSEITASDPNYVYLDPHSDASFPAQFDPNQYEAPINVLDLEAFEPGTKLAPHFRANEFMQKRKGRYGLVIPRLVDRLSYAVISS